MSRGAWTYVWFILLLGALLTALTTLVPFSFASQWLAFTVLTASATLTQLFKANTPNRKLYYPNLVFVFAGLLVLQPFLYAMLVVVSYSIEWAKERLTNSQDLRNWYLQPFNMAMIVISGSAARLVFVPLTTDVLAPAGPASIVTALLAAVVFVTTNQILLTVALVLARGMSWKEVASVDVENIQADLIHTLLGYVVAIVWKINPWLVFPTVAPLFLTYRALMVPQLRKDAATDAKTGLWNSAHFTKLFATELERAKRFGHPLTVIMADLDLLRNINNRYGHLAGDIVLAAIGGIIRSTIRDYDIAARFGGEEFTIALPETGPEEAVAIAERLRRAIEAANFNIGNSEAPIHATMSFGLASFPQDCVTPNDLIHHADLAVYQAKLRGRNCVVLASDVPRSIRPEGHDIDPPESEPKTSSPGPGGGEENPGSEIEPSVKRSRRERRNESRANYPDALLTLFVCVVILAGLIAALAGLGLNRSPDLAYVAVLCAMAVLTELYEVRLYGDSTFSVSVAIMFAAALTAGMLGIVSVSLAIALAHYVRNREIPLYKTAFNWATHVLAGLVPLVAFRVTGIALTLDAFIPLTVVGTAAAMMYFMIETGLVATAIGLSENYKIRNVWREQFQWMTMYYAALCVMGLFMGIVYRDADMGIAGVVVIAIPIAMIYYAQKQYVERTENSARELTRMNRELSAANHQVRAASRAIQQLNEDLFLTVAKMVDTRDPYVQGHSSRVARYALALGREMELPPERLEKLQQAALLHDIGKLGIAEQILNKPGKLTALEYEQVQKHAAIGSDVLEAIPGLRPLAPFVRHHHEWWNAHGYPDGWGGEQIPLESRILAVCDAVDSMASDRPYHGAMPMHDIVEEIERNSAVQFDPTVVEAFKRVLEQEAISPAVDSARPAAPKQTGTFERENLGGWIILPGDSSGGFAVAQ
ncbi:MAG: diguanylate cyclase [Chloroflexi bacterium]|nr:diguanylate cyclase [Chloroflexota bacterium]